MLFKSCISKNIMPYPWRQFLVVKVYDISKSAPLPTPLYIRWNGGWEGGGEGSGPGIVLKIISEDLHIYGSWAPEYVYTFSWWFSVHWRHEWTPIMQRQAFLHEQDYIWESTSSQTWNSLSLDLFPLIISTRQHAQLLIEYRIKFAEKYILKGSSLFKILKTT